MKHVITAVHIHKISHKRLINIIKSVYFTHVNCDLIRNTTALSEVNTHMLIRYGIVPVGSDCVQVTHSIDVANLNFYVHLTIRYT